MHRCPAANHLPCLGPPDGGKFLTRRAEGGLGPEGGPTACCAAAAAAATVAAAPFEVTFEAADEDGVVVVASTAVAAAAADAEEELLALVSNIPGGEGSIAAHPNTLHRQKIRETQALKNPANVFTANFHPSLRRFRVAASRALIGGWGVTACAANVPSSFLLFHRRVRSPPVKS